MTTLKFMERCPDLRVSLGRPQLQHNHLTFTDWAGAIAMVKAQLDVVDEVNTYLNK